MKAYPYMHKHPTSGLTTISEGLDLRDWFAGHALQGMLFYLKVGIKPQDCIVMAEDAYFLADAMMKARLIKKEVPNE